MRKLINTLLLLTMIVLSFGYYQDSKPETSNKFSAVIYREAKAGALSLYERGKATLEEILGSSKFTDTLEATSKDVIDSLGGLNKIPIIKTPGNIKGISGMPDSKYTVNNYEEYYSAIKSSLNNFESSFTIKFNNYDSSTYNLNAVNQVIYDNFDLDYGIKSIGGTLYSSISSHAMTITIEYAFDKDSMLAMRSASEGKAKQIISEIIKPGMSDLQKERAIHDYVVKNTTYDYDNYTRGTLPEEVYTMYGVLVNKKAVCEGYAKTMFKLLNMAGIENRIVIGEADGIPHAWNLVKINGSYTHVDATWDDPVTRTNKGILSHKYFNISDEQISKNHTWDKSKYPKGVAVSK